MICRVSTIVLVLLMSLGSSLGAETSPALIPWPKSIKAEDGALTLAASSRIVYADPALAPLANVLAEEIHLSTTLRLATAAGATNAGDIVLQLDPQLKSEQYAVVVADRAVLRGGNYRAVAWATVSLLQSITIGEKQEIRVPQVSIEDQPVAAYRGLLIDVARQWHPVEDLRPIVEMCRLYKINYLQFHLNDQESFTFPSRAFPSLATSTKGKRRTYTFEEITALVQHADQRGVTIVPEIEGPGHHSGALRGLLGRKGTSCLDMASEKTYEGMATLLGEVAQVFASSPYIHIGADECDLAHVGESDEEKAFMAEHGIKSRDGLYNYYIVRVHEVVKKLGRQTIVWEGFHGAGSGGIKIPKEIIVMPFESAYNPADKLVSHGYSVINTAWKPLYVVGARKWPAEYIYENWNLWLWEHHVNTKVHIQLAKTAPVLGAQMCAWEQPSLTELPSTRERLHAMSERIWNPEAGKTYGDFAARAGKTDRLLDRLVGIIDVKVEGDLGSERHGYRYFFNPVTVKLSAPAIGSIHYTLDESEPTAQSPVYAGPITIAKENTRLEKLFFNSRTKRYDDSGNTAYVKARLFDPGNKAIGDVTTLVRFWHKSPEEIKKDQAGTNEAQN